MASRGSHPVDHRASLCRRKRLRLRHQIHHPSALEECRWRATTLLAHRPPGRLSAAQRRPSQLSESRLPDLYRPHLVATANPTGLSVALGDRTQLPRRKNFAGLRAAPGPQRSRGANHGYLLRFRLCASAAGAGKLSSHAPPAAASALATASAATAPSPHHYASGYLPATRRLVGLRLGPTKSKRFRCTRSLCNKAAFIPKQPAIRSSLCLWIAKHERRMAISHPPHFSFGGREKLEIILVRTFAASCAAAFLVAGLQGSAASGK